MNSPPLPEAWTAPGYALRPETAEDRPFLQELFAAVRGPDFAALGWPEAALAGFLASQFQFQDRHYTAAYPGAVRLIVARHGEPVGRLFLHPAPDDLRIVDIALLPQARNAGLGTALVRAVQALAVAEERSVSLSVALGSPAERLYRRLDFAGRANDGAAWRMRWTRPLSARLSGG